MIPLNRPSIRRKDMDAVLTCMVNDSLGPGERGSELVSSVARFVGAMGGIALRERGRALSLALGMLDAEPGMHVVMDPLVPRYYEALVTDAGYRPAYADVADGGVCIDGFAISELLGTSLSGTPPAAIIARSTLGYAPDLERIAGLGVPIIEDISDGLGANTGDRVAGSYGRFVVVGMEPDAIVTSGGGTLLLAASRADATRLGHAAADLPPDALLPDMNAALGLTQVKELERFIERRAEIASVFARALMHGRHAMPLQTGDGQNVHHCFPVIVASGTGDVQQYARKKGVETGFAFGSSVAAAVRPGGRSAADTDGLPGSDAKSGPGNDKSLATADATFPLSRALSLRCIQFPLYPALTGREISVIERVLTTLP